MTGVNVLEGSSESLSRAKKLVRVRVTVVGRRKFPCLRIALLVSALFFLCLQLHVSNLTTLQTTTEPVNESAVILSMVPHVLHRFLTIKPRNGSHSGNNTHSNCTELKNLNIPQIMQNINRYNLAQTINNEDTFGPVQNDTLIIVIQIHTRIVYLRHLIVSLAQARDIESTLIIFSHDFYDNEANELIQSVDFARTLQIFYPFSIQTHPNSFPGQSPDDCPRDVNYEQAQILKCANADHPDLYGHYREAKFTQTKHHWWWKANRVFNELEVTRNHTGLVLFLEEDHYVAADFIQVLRKMVAALSSDCTHCDILSLGTYLKTYNYFGDSKKAEITPWISSKHNMGMAFNRSVWTQLHECARHFCSYDDYNWDWSLQLVSHMCLKRKLTALVMRGPRVFHIGECGVHHKKENCESTSVISKVQRVLANAKRNLFPRYLTVSTATVSKKAGKMRKGNGGWGDVRDHRLCLNISMGHR